MAEPVFSKDKNLRSRPQALRRVASKASSKDPFEIYPARTFVATHGLHRDKSANGLRGIVLPTKLDNGKLLVNFGANGIMAVHPKNLRMITESDNPIEVDTLTFNFKD
jgi:hypothetical protein